MIQPTGNRDIVLEGMNALSERATLEEDPELQPSLNVHDDLSTLLHDRSLDSKIDIIVREMCLPRFAYINVPLVVEVSVGPNWADLKRDRQVSQRRTVRNKEPIQMTTRRRVIEEPQEAPEAQQAALPIKYRPSSLDDVVGQDPVVKSLRTTLKSSTKAHAYSFTGPSGTGKTTLLKQLVVNELKKPDSHVLIVTPDDSEWLNIPEVHPGFPERMQEYKGVRKIITTASEAEQNLENIPVECFLSNSCF